MAFVNEYIPEADYEKYDLRRVCGEHNEPNRGLMYSRDWTIDRERDAFLIQVWSHRDSQFSGWAFYWKGEWIFFHMTVKQAKDNPAENSCWSLYHIQNFRIRDHLEHDKDEIISDLRAAYSEYAGGGVFCGRANRNATIEFIGE
jgi:hypothetical protein